MKLYNKVIALVTVILVSVLSLYSFFNIRAMKEQVMSHLHNSAMILAQSLEQSIITSGAMEDRKLLQKLVEDFNKIEGIHEVYIVDPGFKIIAHPEEDHVGRTYENKDVKTAILNGKNSTEFKTDDNEKLYDVVIPLIIDGKITGAIEVELDFNKIEEMIYSASYKAVISIIITIIILGLILVAVLFKVLIKPLNHLVDATSQVASGSFQPVSVPSSGDEIGQLIRSFNDMCLSLQKLSERDRSANPLTGLPGNVIIKDEVQRRLDSGEVFTLLYTDLDHFKEFNDTHGFDFGDIIIKNTAEILHRAVNEAGTAGDFIGHIGGDDFVVITTPGRGKQLASRIVQLFDQYVADLRKKYSCVQLSISIAQINGDPALRTNAHELFEKAAELKKKVKQLQGSNFLTEE